MLRRCHCGPPRGLNTPQSQILKSLTFLLASAWSSLGLNSLSAQEALPQAIERIVHSPRFKHAHWGALFVEQHSGHVIYKHEDEKLFIPASTTKLFTVACALDALGADHCFTTPVVRTGEVNDQGELRGNLILVASGDLSFGGRTTPDHKIAFTNVDHTYANGNLDAELTSPDPLEGLNDLARQVAAAGIKQIHGDVLVDDRLFDKAESSGSGPSKVTPCMINDNLIDLVFTPAEIGERAAYTWRPQSSGVRIESQLMTVKADKSLEIKIRDLGHGQIAVSGHIPHGHKPVLKVHEVHDPRAFARTLFIEALHRAGVSVDAATVIESTTSELPPFRDVQTLPQVAVHRSLPFSESAKLILKVSHNLQASTLPLLVASKQGERTLAAGLKHQHKFLKAAHVDVDTISLAGGAGGSRADLVTPRATVQLLRYMATRPEFPVFHAALPRLGIDGTLAKNIPHDSPARDKVQAKTGSLYWDNTMNDTSVMTSKALAGYLTTAKGRPVVFAIFVNYAHLGHGVTVKTFGDDLGKICETVYLYE